MLEAIVDFWKPIKKVRPLAKLKLTDMQIGSVVGFGYVPQAALSGLKLVVTAINSYQFGHDVLTSFVLSNGTDSNISMIIAEAQGEQYLAISRRISTSDGSKLFDGDAINDIISNDEVTLLKCKDNIPELKGWLITNYKREIKDMSGFIHRTDFRNGNDGSHAGEEFKYTLLGSNSNEHAIEIESYADGHIDIYATVYRRTSDISDVIHIDKSQPQDIKPAVKSEVAASEATHDVAKKIEVKEDKLEPVKLESVPLPQLVATPLVKEIVKSETIITEPTKNINEEKKDMTMTTVISNENKAPNGVAASELPPVPSFGSSIKDFKQEIKAVTKTANGMDNESVECDLRVANQLIDEAIRNEMRLSDVVRRIIELPVAHQESVQIPINLADEDYSLLAIRYGIPSSDRNAIKIRIIQDLGDFSGSKKKAA